MNRIKTDQLHTAYRVCAVVVVALLGAAIGQAQTTPTTTVQPGTTTVLDLTTSGVGCDTQTSFTSGLIPKTDCIADPNATQLLKVLAASGLSSDKTTFFGQQVSSIAKVIQNIQIPTATGPSSSALPVQVATEVKWSGGTLVAGIDSTFAQIIGTFRIRDVTNATTQNPGPVVASNTFLFERTDADFEITIPTGAVAAFAEFLNLIEIVDISNSSGADITAFLVRGRTYAIELEAKCDVQVPIFGFGVCLFSSDLLTILQLPPSNLFKAIDNDGFSAANFTVTVGSDPIENLF